MGNMGNMPEKGRMGIHIFFYDISITNTNKSFNTFIMINFLRQQLLAKINVTY